ncbi:MAG: glycosyltransferase family 2 protein [Desulfovibrio sp.]|jgi:GT2 family glycosyltransferase|nr:glycosyltransferase family 2 protein [Desulfovibrio sp.]
MRAAPRVSVIIPVFNCWDLTRNCLLSLRGHALNTDFEVIVADNGSSDATATELAPLGSALFGDAFRFLRFPENINFGPACNAGARAASAPFIFFLNNDTLLTTNCLQPLLRELEEDASLGAVGPLLLYPDDRVQHLGVSFTLNRVLHLYSDFPADHPVVRRKRKLQTLTAAALLLPKKFFFEAGAFCEEYRNGFEDVDLCLQIRRRLGLDLSCIPGCPVIHLEGRSKGRKDCEKSNGTLLSRRCGSMFSPDLHLFGLKDGFEPFISDDYDICLRMTEADEEALEAETAGRDMDFLYELTRRHPLWAGGRVRLIAALDKAGKGKEAAPLFHELVQIRMTAEISREAALFMARHGEDAAAEVYARLHAGLIKSRSDRKAARKFLRRAESHDTFLRKLYDVSIHNRLHPPIDSVPADRNRSAYPSLKEGGT